MNRVRAWEEYCDANNFSYDDDRREAFLAGWEMCASGRLPIAMVPS